MPKRGRVKTVEDSAASVGYEAKLWQMADALRGSMDAAEYKHVVLGLIFLKYISDAFEEQHAKLVAEKAKGADPEDPDEYRAQSIFWVPPEARWAHLKAQLRCLDFGSFNAGSAVPTLNRNHVHNLPTLLPPMGLIGAFERVATANLSRQKYNEDESHTLAALRDALLPNLISGELRVKQMEKLVAEATA
jgi:type I restriction-modification system DNA methylase subunit